MAYELSGSIASGSITSVFVAARAGTHTAGGTISPDGNTIAVASSLHGGATGASDHGIDFWHSGSSGWVESDPKVSVDAGHGAGTIKSIYWLSNSELLALTQTKLTSYVSSSSGWSSNYVTSVGGANIWQHMWVSPGKTVVGVAESIVHGNPTTMDDSRAIRLIHSSSTGFDDIKVIDHTDHLTLGRVTAMSWIDEDNVLIGQSHRDSDAGRVSHYRYGGSEYTQIRACNGHAGSPAKRFGSFIYWHSGSNSGIYGSQDSSSPGTLILSLIPSQSDGYLPSANPQHVADRTTIDTSMLQVAHTATEPLIVYGTTINIDPANPDRVVAATYDVERSSGNQDKRVYFSLESGSAGWKVNQINSDGDGCGLQNSNTFNPSQLAGGASRYVTWKTGNAQAAPTTGFTVYETGLPNQGASSGPASFTLTPSATPLSITEGSTGTVGVVLGKKPASDVVISVTLAGSFSGRATLSAASLTFTAANWDTQQNVTITATPDDIDHDNATGNITFSVVDASSDDEFDTLANQTVALTVVDNDTAGFTLTPSADPLQINEDGSGTVSVKLDKKPASGNVVIDTTAGASLSGRAILDKNRLTFDDTNWNVNQVVQISGVPDDILRNNSVGNVTFAVNNGLTAHTKFHNLTDAVTVTVLDDETASIVLTPSVNPFAIDEGATGTITAVLGKEPAGTVKVDIALPAQFSGRATADKTSFTFDNTNWNNPAAHTVTITATPDDIDNDPITNNITFSVNDGATTLDKFKDLPDQTVATTIKDDDDAGLTVTSDNPINLSEGGPTADITVVLQSEPDSGAVRINITPQGDLSGRLTVPTHVDFDDTNWDQPQTVTVLVPDDRKANSDVSGILRFSVDATSSPEFVALDPDHHDITVNITADATDVPGLEITPVDFRIVTKEEGETKATLTVKLKTSPTDPVTITLSSQELKEKEHKMTPNPVSFVFDENNFDTARTVTFQGIEDNIPDGNVEYNMVLTATSADPDYNITQLLTLINEDSGVDGNAGPPGDDEEPDPPGEAGPGSDNPDPDTPPGADPFMPFPQAPQAFDSAFTGILGSVYQPQNIGGNIPKKIYFEPSTIESIDTAVYEYITELNLFTDTNEGFLKVPVMWGTSERSFLSKKEPLDRDNQGLLKLPVITIRRTGIEKSLASKGVFQGNVPENSDEQGGSLVVARVVNQEKTSAYAESLRKRTTLGRSAPIVSNKTVFKIISAPMPVNVELTYDIVITTEYQQQMNDLVLPFATKTGTINYVKLESNGHRYEGFIDGQFTSQDNLSNYTTDERKFETTIRFRVVGYLVGQGKNREKPHFAIRENFVEVKIPREKVITDPKELEKYGL